jgi:hypothetical protein
MRGILQFLSLAGVLLFGGAFVVSFVNPIVVERAAREIIRIEVERRVGAKVDSLSNARIADFAKRALQNTDVDIARAQRRIREDVPRKVADVVANMLNADCECRKRIVEYSQKLHDEKLSSLMQVREQLVSLAEGAYASVSQNLIREFRIFAASNAIAFGLLGIIALARRNAAWQLVLPAVVLVGAVLVTGSLYLFNQNWVHAIVFSQYVGFGYAVYLSCAALLLADILMNRARVTTEILNAALQIVGSVARVVPC